MEYFSNCSCKIASLCDEKDEFNNFEIGKGIYFSIDSKEKNQFMKISEFL